MAEPNDARPRTAHMDASGLIPVWIVWALEESGLQIRAICTSNERAMRYRKGALEPTYGTPAIRCHIEKTYLDHLYGGEMLSSYLKAANR